MQNNPTSRIDPTGMLDDDYLLNKDGSIEKIRETNDNFDVIYNSDMTAGLQVDKGLLEGKIESDDFIRLDHDDVYQMEIAYNFFASFSDVEWEFNVFQGEDKFATLSSGKDSEYISGDKSVAWEVLARQENVSLLYTSHSHSGPYDSQTTYPAIPSGFRLSRDGSSFTPIQYSDGDRRFHSMMRSFYGERHPAYSHLFSPGSPFNEIKYNGNSVIRK